MLVKILGAMEGASLNVDVEHLSQACQYGFTFNLGRFPEGIVRVGDLTPAEIDSMKNCGLLREGEDTLIDYEDLIPYRKRFLEEFGFLARKGSPVIYNKRLSLEGELNEIGEFLEVGSITPGFQARQAYSDNGRLMIGSHLPGITESYIQNPELRYLIKQEVKSIHYVCKRFMNEEGIKDVEFEPQIDDGFGIVYKGSEWEEQISEGIRQLMENLRSGCMGDNAPYFLR